VRAIVRLAADRVPWMIDGDFTEESGYLAGGRSLRATRAASGLCGQRHHGDRVPVRPHEAGVRVPHDIGSPVR